MCFFKNFSCAFLFSLVLFPALSENFRVRKVHPVNLSEESNFEKTVQIGINDGIAVFLPSKNEKDTFDFLEGIEVTVLIPSSVSEWRDSVALSVYDGITPKPSGSQIDYSGSRIFIQPLPSKRTWICQIPLFKETSLKDSSYITKVPVIPEVSKGYTFIRFQPIMKGVPEETLEATLSVSIKPCFKNLGRLNMKFKKADESISSPLDIMVDDKIVSSQFEGKAFSLLLEPGLHNISVQSGDFRGEVRSSLIELAKNTEETFILKSLKPLFSVTAPENVEIFFDGQKFTELGKETEISEGEHTLKFSLGGYEVVRTINAEKGKTYSCNLNIDLQISEE